MRINNVTLLGRLTADPEIKYTQSGVAIANFSLAYNEKWKDKASGELKEDVHFFTVEAFGTSAQYAEKYLTKGSRVAVVGSLRQNRWEDNGQSRSRVVIRAFTIQGLDYSNPNGEQAQGEQKPAASEQTPPAAPEQAAPAASEDEEDIPF